MYSVIDIESNGAPFRKESIIEIAVYKYDGHRIVDQFISLVNPESDITPFVQKLTSISPKMVKTAPKFHELAKRVVEITEHTTLVGHNIEFDYRMLRQEFKRLGYEFKINTIDTIPLAKKLIPQAESYNLGKLVKSLGIPLVHQHRASGDAKATLELFKLLMIKDKDSEIIQQHHDEVNEKSYLNKIRDLTQDLPAEKGILYFQDQDGKIIFSDFVDDLNKFSKGVFHSKSKRWITIQEDVEQIQYELTGNDILAKLMMKTKGLKKTEKLPFGLYHKSEKYFVDKISNQQVDKPLLKFKSFTQGIKAVSFINSRGDLKEVKNLQQLLAIHKKDELWLSTGRTLGEKSFLVFEKGKLSAYGFYELYTQIESLQKLSSLKIDIDFSTVDLQNDLKLGLLRGDFEIVPTPLK
ncbi:3'-5' exonuclease [Kaistella antarctica]|uniref:DNA polymerase III subunit epsilon n=1 Tax=Kaistella antarctica TaxID=266748 RepID=A0A448NTE6_9FLAO|nr:3'-5' exonuclease [Kaistella antarctica]KEY18166.1 DNA polymerase III subunit epsilon [Kaistella antarctica]SEV83258.1 DNA polymerase-3 subunit epsilon [Kaistella antarctica]VEI00758.1 Probable ATP-dependent helicase dinG homolog [Kaistella antarctica]